MTATESSTPLAALVDTSEAVARESGRNEKVRVLGDLLDRVDEDEAPLVVAYLSGEPPQGKVGVGPATVDEVLPVPPAGSPSLTLRQVDGVVEEIAGISGSGARARRREALERLFRAATEREQRFLVGVFLGELRQGAQEGLLVEALAEAADASADRIRKAVMLEGDAGTVAREVLKEGSSALSDLGLRLFRPVQPMLAGTADGPVEALEHLGRAAVEFKLDGARLQVHRSGGEVRVYTRRLNEATEALPEIVEAARSLRCEELVLDGEALALRPDGTPRPFQTTMRRFGRKRDVDSLRRELPLTPFFFDCLYLDGVSLIDRPGEERFRALEDVLRPGLRVPRIVTDAPPEAEEFLRRALGEGHEGLVAKSLEAPYRAGSRGRSWLKIKPIHTADLVILAAEWGHGRRRGWLSNVHLGARDPDTGDLAMVGKTFKGMTDEMLEWQTGRFQELERRREEGVVHVRPEVVAEVAFDGVQKSPTYDSGVALRFARIKGYRHDKGPEDADTLARLRAIREGRVDGE